MAKSKKEIGLSVASPLIEWRGLLTEIPGVAKAVAKLIGSGASAGTAWIDILTAKGEARSSEVRGSSAATNELRHVMVEAATKILEGDPDLGRRALEHFSQRVIGAQVNREEVTRLALEDLSNIPLKDFSIIEPTDDWLNIFSSYAENASSSTMREHWASILAGEIRQPGSISLVALKMMSVIDINFANIISNYSKYVLFAPRTGVIPFITEFTEDPVYDDFLALDSIGFLTVGDHEVSDKELTIGSYKLQAVEDLSEGRNFPAFVLTRAGTELIKIIGQSPMLDDVILLQKSMIDEDGCYFDVIDSKSGELLATPARPSTKKKRVSKTKLRSAANESHATRKSKTST